MASQTPLTVADTDGMERYRTAWLTANALLRDGFSWSGYERNCAFLNLGEGRWANVSAAVGFDFLDDARGLGVCDWDGDGDLDIWMTCRTGPNVRFLRNDLPATARSAAFRLRGVRCNRDAIGARLTLHTSAGTMVKTLSAGDGYLSQSDKWLHFGLGNDAKPLRLTVRWPGGERKTFDLPAGHRRFSIVQGEKEVRTVPVPKRLLSLAAATLPLTPVSSAARIVPHSRLPLPRLNVEDLAGERAVIGGVGDQAMLVLLWASWCPPCVQEMKALAAAAKAVQKAGLKVVALSVDAISAEKSEAVRLVERFLQRTQFPFAVYWADQNVIDQLEVWQRTLLETHLSLPLPSSLLIDRAGRVAALYRGPATVRQWLSDASLLSPVSPRGLMEMAVPFSGTRGPRPALMDPIQVALKYYQAGYYRHARNYLRQLIQVAETQGPGHETMNRGELHYFMGTLLEESGQIEDSLHAYRFALTANPKKWEAHRNLARLFFKKQAWLQATFHYREALAIESGHPDLRVELSVSLLRQGQRQAAASELAKVLECHPSHAAAFRLLRQLRQNPVPDESP